ncbi:amino acid permease-domain-containing protein [Epithele typhae]|uniref:amino acid permease-domain-containing protein n=1 Tax=Epithele typhae TaxID=378194 RepID=UPI0020073E1A|nr:amino acid permease-domain-containing protein [Epithele typhae]KAH9919190.1 amino acid permease-domain-containing protein [Epithele typhae]
MATPLHASGLRDRPKPYQKRVEFQELPFRSRFQQQRERILKFQRRWERIKEDLPPQLSRRHIGMISIGGVIGTGLFLGSAEALKNGGPIGSLIGYMIVGSMVFCLCVSVGEMIAFLPNVGGVVGLADLYVDPALGFSLGWAAWYNWSITLPAEISAAALVIGYWKDLSTPLVTVISAIFLLMATIINCFPSKVYGEMEFYLSFLKVVTILVIVISCLMIDLGASHLGWIGLRHWIKQPFAHDYLGIDGSLGRFLGFYAVIMQATFSFSGSEVPGIAAGEVIDASRNVPRALRKVWIRITLFYVGGIFVAGLLVPADDPHLGLDNQNGSSSPFVIAFNIAGWKVLPHMLNAAILVSAWSAASSDIYVSSRFLFFLACRGHAPSIFAHLFRYPRRRTAKDPHAAPYSEPYSDSGTDPDSDSESGGESIMEIRRDPPPSPDSPGGPRGEEVAPWRRREPTFVIPLASVFASASVGLLTFLSYHTGSAATVFNWLVAVASIACLLSWSGMLFTYIRWHQGTVYYEEKYRTDMSPAGDEARAQIKQIKIHRQWGQPYLAWYAFATCILVLLTNGWAVFLHNGWKVAELVPSTEEKMYNDSHKISQPILVFLSSYIPLPIFVLLTFGYKLVMQTEMMPLDKMTFFRGEVPSPLPECEPTGWLERLLAWLMVI